MADKILLHDFIEIEYTGKFADDTVFDTTSKETAEKNNIFSPQIKYKPAIVCIGEKQLIPGLDSALLDKETEKNYTIELTPVEAFGKKDIKKIRLIPPVEFQKRNINPQPGMQIDMDGAVGRVIKASGGRILVNFNHPFAGREVVYEIKVNKKITDKEIKLKSFLELSFNIPDIKAEVKEDKAVVTLSLELPKPVQEELSKKLKEIVKLKEVSFKKEESKAGK
jgi:FKBP-type peptidyl-prolyl cis-trans isomerase 2